jgi:hypothetical protein
LTICNNVIDLDHDSIAIHLTIIVTSLTPDHCDEFDLDYYRNISTLHILAMLSIFTITASIKHFTVVMSLILALLTKTLIVKAMRPRLYNKKTFDLGHCSNDLDPE